LRVLSVNVSLPRDVVWRGKTIRTGIHKEPVAGRVPLRRTNLDGDGQADLRVHGGPDKAVYAYPSEHYELWSRERPELLVRPGAFGENLTTGPVDDDVSVGDRFRIGTAELVVTQPRLPCFKLGIRMGRDEFVPEFLERGLLGFYFAVFREGEVAAGDPIVFETGSALAPGKPRQREGVSLEQLDGCSSGCASRAVKSCGPSGSQDLALLAKPRGSVRPTAKNLAHDRFSAAGRRTVRTPAHSIVCFQVIQPERSDAGEYRRAANASARTGDSVR
jgi:MOSC domain-containing protein YiiM